MKKILFLIHDLGPGGAEKVLINLVNNMDRSKFDITVMSLFGGGVNEQFLKSDIRLINCHKKAFPGNSHIMKLFSPKTLYKHYIKEHYDIVVSYLEGPCARIVSGCDSTDTKKVCWIHIEQHTKQKASASFRSFSEAEKCYNRFDKIICVSEFVKNDFCSIFNPSTPVEVLYNTVESDVIKSKALEPADTLPQNKIKLCGVGKLLKSKGFDRLARIHKRLIDEGYPVCTCILGEGPQRAELEEYIKAQGLTDSFYLLGYNTNPYKYVKNCDIFVCASFAEGFSTAATEALIVGTAVCTVEVSGMKEMLGESNEFGIVTKNNEQALYLGIKGLLDNPQLLSHYKKQSALRGESFNTESTVLAVQKMLINLF